jgi:tRNA modification GTPase
VAGAPGCIVTDGPSPRDAESNTGLGRVSELSEAGAEGDTIAAIATAGGPGAIGIIRLSGPEALAVADRAFRPSRGGSIRTVKTFSLTHGHIVDPLTRETVDEVLLAVMRGPRSYTREDVVEAHCHGGALAARTVLRLMVQLGARLAEPGEFTRRAFINGRIDLTQAESVSSIVAARSSGALRASVRQLQGGLSERVRAVRGEIVVALASIEASLDFSDEDVEDVDWCSTRGVLELARGRLAVLLKTAFLGRALEEGISTAIVGKPNAGKSSLMNALVMRERAIVSETPGTTRDTVEDEVEIGGMPIRLVDTAGLRCGGDEVERMGVERSLQALQQADLVLVVVDMSGPVGEDELAVLGSVAGGLAIVVGNKLDLTGAGCREIGALTERVDAANRALGNGISERKTWVCAVSALTGEGIEGLRNLIEEAVSGEGVHPEEPILASERQRALVGQAAQRLDDALAAMAGGRGEELVCEDMRAAAEALGRITGEDVGVELLDEIFSRFCLGK